MDLVLLWRPACFAHNSCVARYADLQNVQGTSIGCIMLLNRFDSSRKVYCRSDLVQIDLDQLKPNLDLARFTLLCVCVCACARARTRVCDCVVSVFGNDFPQGAWLRVGPVPVPLCSLLCWPCVGWPCASAFVLCPSWEQVQYAVLSTRRIRWVASVPSKDISSSMCVRDSE